MLGGQEPIPQSPERVGSHEGEDFGVEDIHNGLVATLRWDQRANKLGGRKEMGEINHRMKQKGA